MASAATTLSAQVQSFVDTANVPIPDENAYGITRTITIPSTSDRIGSIRIGIRQDQGWDADVDFWLLPPGVTWAGPYVNLNNGPVVELPPRGAIQLSTNNGNNDVNFGTGTGGSTVRMWLTSDQDPTWPTTTSVETGAGPFTGGDPDGWVVEGLDAFKDLYGSNPSGNWTLVVADGWAEFTGTLISWEIQYVALSTSPAAANVNRGPQNNPGTPAVAGQNGQVLGQFRLGASGAATNYTQIRFDSIGSGNLSTNFSRIQAWLDNNGDGLLDGGDTMIGDLAAPASANVTVPLSPAVNVADGGFADVLLVGNVLASPAAAGVRMQITGTGQVTESTAATVRGLFPVLAGYHPFLSTRSAARAPITPKTIRDNNNQGGAPSAGHRDSIVIPAVNERIASFRMGFRINHQDLQHLDIYLLPPGVDWMGPYDNTTTEPPGAIMISTDNGGNGNDFGTGTGPFVYTIIAHPNELNAAWDPDENITQNQGEAPFVNTPSYQPEDLADLQAIYDSNPTGVWTLAISDDTTGSAGTLLSWFIEWLAHPIADVSGNPDFGNSNVGVLSSGSPRTFTITNSGDYPLLISSINFSGANPGDFTLVGAPPASVPANSSVNIQVNMTPGAVGARTATLNVVCNDQGVAGTVKSVGIYGVGNLGNVLELAVGASNVPGAAIQFGTVDALLGQYSATAGSAGANITSVTYRESAGRVLIDNLTGLRLYHDVNADGALDGGDVLLGTATLTAGASSAAIPVSLSLPAQSFQNWLLVGDVASSPADRVLSMEITGAADVTGSPTATATFPVNTGARALNPQRVFTSTPATGLPIPNATTAGVTDSIVIPATSETVAALRVGLRIVHPNDADLDLYLLPPGVTWGSPFVTPPAGAIELSTDNGGTGKDYGNGFLQLVYANLTSAADPVFTPGVNIAGQGAGATPFTDQIYRVEDPADWNARYGVTPSGTWTLVMLDDAGSVYTTGYLVSWQIEYIPPGLIETTGLGNWGSQQVGVQSPASPQTYTISNIGGLDTDITAITLVGANAADWSFVGATGAPLTLAEGESHQVSLNWTPGGIGARNAVLRVTYNTGTQVGLTRDFALSGTGTLIGEIGVERPSGTGIADGGADNAGTGQVGIATPLVYTVRNTAVAGDINLGAVSVTGEVNCSVVITQPGVSLLGPGASTTFQIDVTPAGTGAFSFSLQLANDDTNENPYDINVSGNAVMPPNITFVSPVDHGVSNVGVPATPVVHNIGNNGGSALTITSITFVGANAGDWSLLSPAAPPPDLVVFPAGNLPLNVQFTPSGLGARAAQLRIVSNTGGVTGTITLIDLTGNGTQATIGVTTPVNYGNSNVGVQTAPVNHQIDNSGSGPLEITAIALSGVNAGDWVLNGLPSFPHTIASLGNLAINGQFTPSATGARNAQIDITWNQGGGVGATLTSIALTGNGTLAAIGVTTPVNYGDNNVGVQTAPVNHQIDSTGTGPMRITGISLTGSNAGDWALSGLPAFPHTVANGGNLTINGQFTPSATGARTAAIEITWDQGGGVGSTVTSITLNGNGTLAAIGVTTPVNYGSSNVGIQTAPVNHQIDNSGTGPMRITGITLTGANAGDWVLNGLPGFPHTVAASGNLTINGQFTPSATGARTATIEVTWDQGAGVGSTVTSITLDGTGTLGALGIASPVNYGSSNLGVQTAPLNHQIDNNGTGDIEITAIALSGANAGDWILNGLPSFPHTIPAAGSLTINGQFTPTATGARTALIDITWNQAGGGSSTVTSITLNGTGTTGTLGVTSPVSYGSIPLGTTSPSQNHQLDSSGTGPIRITGITLIGANAADWLLSGLPAFPHTIASAGSLVISGQFTPSALGAHVAQVEISWDQGAGVGATTTLIDLSGTGIPGGEIDIERPVGTPVADGATDTVTGATAGLATSLIYRIENNGTSTLNLGAVSFSNNVNCGVVITQPGASSVAVGGFTTFQVDVTPVASGNFNFDLDVASDDQDENPYDIQVDGNAASGAEIDIQRGGSIADGGSDIVNGTVAGVLTSIFYTIENLGSATLTITGQGFSTNSNCNVTVFAPLSSSLAPAATTTMQVDITPLAAGAFSFVLQVDSDDVDEPDYEINVSGTAAVGGDIDVERPFGTTIADGGADTETGAVAGVTTSLLYRIENTGTATLTLGAVTVNNTVNCGVLITQPGAASLGVGGTTTFQIDVTPAAAGIFSFDIEVASDDLNENPYDIAFSATAVAGGEIDIERPVGTPIADGGGDVVGGTAGVLSSLTYRVENNGTALLTLGALTFNSNVNCSVTVFQPLSGTVAVGGFTTFQVDYTPIGTGAFGFNLELANDDVNENPYNIAVSGSALSGGEINVQRPAGTNIADGGTDNGPTGIVAVATNLVYTVQNSGGTAALAVGVVSVTGAFNCGVVITQPGASSLAVGASTTFQIDVTPAATGAFGFVLHLANDDTNENPYDITYSSTAVTAPNMTYMTPVDHGNSNVGVPAATVVQNIGNNGGAALAITSITFVGSHPGDWALLSPAAPPPNIVVFPGGNVPLNVRFTPSAAGARSAQLRIVSNTGGVAGTVTLIDLTGNGTSAVIGVTSPVDYGDSNVGVQTAPVNHQIDNTGTGPMTITAITLTGANAGDWILNGLPAFPATVANGASLTINGQFTPSALGARTASIQISWNQGGGVGATVTSIVLDGNGTQAAIGVTTPVNYGDSNLGVSTPPVNHVIDNNGTGPMQITGITLTGANAGDWALFGLPAFPHTVASLGDLTISGQFTPTALGARTANIEIAWNQGGGVGATVTGIVLDGNGTQAIFSVTTPVNYGSINVGVQTGPVNHQIDNLGTGPLEITAIALGGANAGDWSLSGIPILPITLTGGSNLVIDGQFLPTATGARTATIDITWNDGGANNFDSIVLNGAGTTGFVTSTTPVNYGSVVVGSSSGTVPHQVDNAGTGDARITAISVTGPDAGAWALTGLPALPLTIGSGGNTSFNGEFTPSGAGAHAAAIEITWDNGAGTGSSVFTINLSGSGQIPSSITNVSVGIDDGGPVRVQGDVNGPAGNFVDVSVTYSGGANPGAAVIAGAGSYTVAGNVILGVPVNTTLVFYWDAYATEGHTTASDYVITLSPSISGSPGTPGSSPMFTLTRSGGWVQHVTPSLQAPGGFGHSAVYDSANDRMAVFAGKRGGTLYNEVWVLERGGLSDAWRRITPSGTAPVARQYHGAVYDATNGRMIVFGGNGNAGPLSDTWSLDLTRGAEAWTQIATGSPATPLGRYGHSFLLDTPNNRVIMFGGSRFGGFLGDTWSLDLTLGAESWGTAAITTAGTPPSARWGHAAVIDTVNNRMVTFGGRVSTGYTDTVFELTLGGTPTWSQVSVTGTPGNRYFTTYGYDPVGNSLIFQSGYQGTVITTDAWQLPLSGAGAHVWSQLPGDATASSGRVIGATAYDAGREQLLFFGGLGNGSVNLTSVSALDLSGAPAWSVPPFAANANGGPEARWGGVMAYDTANDRVFLWGGKDLSTFYTDLWMLDRSVANGDWTKLAVSGAAPAGRVYPAFTYDSVGNRLVMHGGQLATGGYAADLWTLNLATATWTQHSAGGIPARMRHSVAYDSGNDRAYVFGGYDGSVRGDAWYFDFGAMTWNAVTVTGIGPRYGHAAVYDSINQRVVVFAGRNASSYLIDVWAMDTGSSAWTDISPVAGAIPLSRYLFAGAANGVGSRAWMHGGSHGNEMGDLWELDLSGGTASWTDITPSGGPLGRITHMGCEDGSGILYVGFGFRDTDAAGDLWSIDTNNPGAGWSSAWQAAKPASIVTANVALDVANNRLISFGGIAGGTHDPGTWQLNLGNPVAAWSPLSVTGTAPSARRSASMVYDPNGGSPRMIMYGGRRDAGYGSITDELWALDLTLGSESWTLLSPAIVNNPGRRTQHTAIVDGAGRMVVYGGVNDSGITLNTVFALDLGSLTWTQLTPGGTGPIARFAHAAVYDAPRDRMIVYGGRNGNSALADAWELDLGTTTWAGLGATGAAPGGSYYHSMVVDAAGDRVLMYGGYGTSARNGLYELDLTTDNWTQRFGTVAEPQSRWAHGAVWDTPKSRMVVVGGFYDGEISATQNSGEEAETWFWGD